MVVVVVLVVPVRFEVSERELEDQMLGICFLFYVIFAFRAGPLANPLTRQATMPLVFS